MTLIEEFSNQLIPIVVIVAFGWYISHFAKATIPRLLFFIFGAYFAILGRTEFDHLIGLGFVLPHVKFFFEWIIDILNGFKRGTLDFYYSVLTIYYKTRNFFIRIHRFFSGKKSKSNKEQKDYYQEQEYREYEDFRQSSNNRQRKQQRQEQREQESTHEESSSNHEESNQNQDNKDTYDSYQEKVIEDKISDEHKQFFSSSYYEVLGVTPNDDFNTIKKKFRKLQRRYHPDLNMDKSEFYTKISQNLNKAYEYFQKIHST